MRFINLLALLSLTIPAIGPAEEPPDTPTPAALEAWREGFSWHLRALAFASQSSPILSDFNPDNEIARLPGTEYEVQVRPNLNFETSGLRLMAKPRFISRYTQWRNGTLDGTSDSSFEIFMNEWLGRIEFHPSFFVSYGRENLQWGPSASLSPSNPFFFDNGRSNPKREIGGRDFFRMVYLPAPEWTVSFIGNTAPGRDPAADLHFKPIYAVKTDYTGTNTQLGLIVSDEQNRRHRLGGYGQWTASDALLLYTEWAGSLGTDGLYPQTTSDPVGWRMSVVKEDSNRTFGTALIGGSYTLELGPTLTAEYLYNPEGYTESEADRYFALAEDASELFRARGPETGSAASILGQALNPGLRLLRRHYLFLQFLETEIRDQLDLTFRYTRNLDDGSGSFVPNIEWSFNDRLQFFALGVINSGDKGTEFSRLFRYQGLAGFEIIFN